MNSHTKEPWANRKGYYGDGAIADTIVDSGGDCIAHMDKIMWDPKSSKVREMKANAARICAAVNATAGISTGDLEKGAIEELVNVCKNIREDIERLAPDGKWDGDFNDSAFKGWADGLRFALLPFQGEGK